MKEKNERRTPEERRKLEERFSGPEGAKDIRRLEQLGRNLRGARARVGMQQEDVALRAGISVAQYARAERGLVSITALTLIKIAGAMGVEVGVFFQDIQ